MSGVRDGGYLSTGEQLGEVFEVFRRDVAVLATDDQHRTGDLAPLRPVVAGGEIRDDVNHHGRLKRGPAAVWAALEPGDPGSGLEPFGREEPCCVLWRGERDRPAI